MSVKAAELTLICCLSPAAAHCQSCHYSDQLKKTQPTSDWQCMKKRGRDEWSEAIFWEPLLLRHPAENIYSLSGHVNFVNGGDFQIWTAAELGDKIFLVLLTFSLAPSWLCWWLPWWAQKTGPGLHFYLACCATLRNFNQCDAVLPKVEVWFNCIVTCKPHDSSPSAVIIL